MHDNHYDVITKMPGFVARHSYCHTFKKAYDNREEHLCPNECKCCGFSPICPKSPGEVAKTAIDSSRANGVTISIKALKTMPALSVKV